MTPGSPEELWGFIQTVTSLKRGLTLLKSPDWIITPTGILPIPMQERTQDEMALASPPAAAHLLPPSPHNLQESNYVECKLTVRTLNYISFWFFIPISLCQSERKFILWDPRCTTYLELCAFGINL